ncbi:type II toxin-antitoxin system YafQ family toxin [Prevotella sp. tf2-5]|uniref:type II toxin-antitoxin system YafQ family toxin n=1 Tax=Prevotella sp. tf2-5 TaxID=1761889 RepID=UPI0008E0BF33|nr:mRNA interferase YafQ [Prevotella sp. tf2-5]
MKKLQPTTQYKKDLKRFKNNPTKLEALREILLKLQNDQPIPAEYLPHMLHGNYKGCMECHIQNDFLLIWIDPDTDIIELVRWVPILSCLGKSRM